MPSDRQLLAIIGKRYPAFWDAKFPHGPASLNHSAEVMLNPQPLPPYALGSAVATEFIRTAWLAERFGLDQARLFSDIEDICPPPRKLPKLPPWWPWPWPTPDPHPDWFTDYHLGFAARLAAVSVDVEGTKLGELLDAAIGRSVEMIKSVRTS